MNGLRGVLNDPVLTLIFLALLAIVGVAALALLAPRIDVRRAGDLGRIFVGVRVPPLVVATARRGVTFLVTGLLFRYGPALGMEELADRATAAVVAAACVELAWGLHDQLRKAAQNDVNPPPVAGGTDLPAQ